MRPLSPPSCPVAPCPVLLCVPHCRLFPTYGQIAAPTPADKPRDHPHHPKTMCGPTVLALLLLALCGARGEGEVWYHGRGPYKSLDVPFRVPLAEGECGGGGGGCWLEGVATQPLVSRRSARSLQVSSMPPYPVVWMLNGCLGMQVRGGGPPCPGAAAPGVGRLSAKAVPPSCLSRHTTSTCTTGCHVGRIVTGGAS